MSQGLSSHGTLVARYVSSAWETIGELGGDITPPPLTRPESEITPHNEGIDSYVVGVLKRGPMTLGINFLPDNATHDHLTGLIKWMIDKTHGGFQLTWPDASLWVFSGFVTNFAGAAPVREGGISADVSIRPSGPHIIDGVAIS